MFESSLPDLVAFWLCLFAQNKIDSIYTHIDVIIYPDTVCDKFDPNTENWLFKLRFGIQTNSNMLNSIVISIFQSRNTIFGQICSKKTKLFNMKILYLHEFRYTECDGDIHFNCPGPKPSNSNMLNSIVMFIFVVFTFVPKFPFLGKLGSKNQNCQLQLKSFTSTN